MKVLVAGDYCPRDRVSRKIQSSDTADLFASVKETIAAADYAIVNFECAVVDGKAKPITKCGPNLKCQPEAVKVLKDGGFDCVTVANNHFRDFGDEGVLASLRYFKANNLDYVGGGKDIAEAETVLYKKFDDGVLAVINVCENEFSIASESRGGSAPLDVIDVCHRIKEAKEKARNVIVIVHGGHEHWQYPSPRMKKWYRFFVESGADVVVNHHQHCYSGYEVYQGKPIFYGLGNFCFDHPKKRRGIWNEGYMVILDFTETGTGYELIPYRQCDETPAVELMDGPAKQSFEQMVKAISKDHKSKTIITSFTPYNSEYVRAAAGRRWIPYLIPRNKMAEMMDFISCEAHRDVLVESLQRHLEK